MKWPFLLLFIVGSHFYVAPIFKFILKNIFLHQIKAKGHDKGHQILKEGPPGAVWIFSEFEYRYLVELESKFSCTISHHSGTFSKLAKFTKQNHDFCNFEAKFRIETRENDKKKR